MGLKPPKYPLEEDRVAYQQNENESKTTLKSINKLEKSLAIELLRYTQDKISVKH